MKSKSLALKVNREPSKGNCGAGCWFQYQYYLAADAVYDKPKKGDKVIFGTALEKKKITHIGLVVAVNGSKITTVEGNKSNQVKKCSYTLGAKGSKILKFLKPAYNDQVTADEVCAYALSQVGYKETGVNHNKYSKELDAINYYNGKKDPAETDWCAIFTDACVYACTDEKPKEDPKPLIKIKPPVPASSFNKSFNKRYILKVDAPMVNLQPESQVIKNLKKGDSVRCYGFFRGSFFYCVAGEVEGYINRRNLE